MLNKEKTKPNILFLLIDSLRADKVYGDQRSSKTPNLDKMIKTGTYFTQAISPSDATILSLGSIFTGLLPFKTGNIKNKRINEKINGGLPTITNVLKNSGNDDLIHLLLSILLYFPVSNPAIVNAIEIL